MRILMVRVAIEALKWQQERDAPGPCGWTTDMVANELPVLYTYPDP